MRRPHLLLLASAVSLVASCALFARTYRPPRAAEADAAKVKFPWGTPRETVVLSGTWLRAVTMALDDFLPEEESERAKAEGEEASCLSRRDNYHVTAFVWSPRGASDAGDGGAELEDGGMAPEVGAGEPVDAGQGDAFSQPGMPKAPPIIYVSIYLLPGACDLLGSPLMDAGALYAIDTVGWRILAIHH